MNDTGSASQTTEKAKNYQRKQLQLELTEEIATFLFLIAWVWIAPRFVVLFPDMGRYPLLILTAVTIYMSYQIALFIFDYLSGYKLEHEFDLSNETFPKWLWRHTKSISLSGLMLGVLIVLLYTAIWHVSYWYIWSWAVWILFTVVLAQLFPVLILPIFYKSTRLENDSLLHRLRALSEGTGVDIEGVYSLELSESTKKGNAMLTGLGKTRRVLLGDTLLNKLKEEEIEVVYAHELGHHVYRHVIKTLILHALASIAIFAIIYGILNPVAKMDPHHIIARLPVMSLAISIFTFLWKPFLYAISRHFEIQCDKYALNRTNNPQHFVTAFEALAEQHLADPAPPRWVVILYYDHPPIHERIALAKHSSP